MSKPEPVFTVKERRPVEALDLGMRITGAYAAFILPLYAVCASITGFLFLLLFDGFALPAMVMVWLFKPLYERVIMYVLANKIWIMRNDSGAIEKTRFVRLRPVLFTQLFVHLTFKRLSPFRIITHAIKSLEGSKGKAYRIRRRNILRSAKGITISFMILMELLEIWLFWSFMLLIWSFSVGSIPLNAFNIFTENNLPVSIYHLACYVVAITITGPYATCACFSLYLNRRVIHEGWDMEIMFKAIRDRLSQKIAEGGARILLCAAVTAVLFLSPVHLSAETAASNSWIEEGEQSGLLHTIESEKKRVRRLYIDETGKKRTVWEISPRFAPAPLEKEQKPGLAQQILNALGVLKEITPVLIIILAAVIVLLLLIQISRKIGKATPGVGKRRRQSDTSQVVDVPKKELIGLRLAREKWEQGNLRAAMSMLYRAVLAGFSKVTGTDIQYSRTEGECERIIRQGFSGRPAEKELLSFFNRISTCWKLCAWAKRPPGDDEFFKLSHNAECYFSGRSNEDAE